jgi:hypothetical protein
MKKVLAFLVLASMTLACQQEEITPDANSAEVLAAWGSSEPWAQWSNGGYTIYNNIWGQENGPGPQSIWANSYSNWGVWANHPNTGGIKSYPNSTRYVGRRLSALTSCTSRVSATTPAGGAWASTFDIWDNAKQHEIMLWMNYTSNSNGSGNIKPISYNWNSSGYPIATHTNVSVGGHTWNVFRGHNGNNYVYSFLRTTKTNNATVDVKAIAEWVRARGWFGDITVGDVQFGYEITSSSGGMNFITNSYSVAFN